MATGAQRFQSIGDALVNGVATQQQLTRLGTGIAISAGQIDYYNTLTNAQKADFAVKYIRTYLLGLVKSGDQSTAFAGLPNVSVEFQEAP